MNQLPDQEPTSPVPTRCAFTVSGALGPVLLNACQPDHEPTTQSCTIIHADLPRDWGVADVVRLLASRDVQLEAVTVCG